MLPVYNGEMYIREAVQSVLDQTYTDFELLVSDDLLPVEERHFDRKGRLARTMRFDEVRSLGGRRIPAHFTLVPEGVEGQRTDLRYLEVQFDADVPADTFTLSRLERSR